MRLTAPVRSREFKPQRSPKTHGDSLTEGDGAPKLPLGARSGDRSRYGSLFNTLLDQPRLSGKRLPYSKAPGRQRLSQPRRQRDK